MRRTTPIGPEIARRIHDPQAKDVVPEPIHEHPCGQRIFRTGNPLPELHPTPLLRLIHLKTERPKHGERIRSDDLPLLRQVAPIKPLGFLRLGENPRPTFHATRGRPEALFQVGDFGLKLARNLGVWRGKLRQKGVRISLSIEGLAVIRTRHRPPLLRLHRHLDFILRRQPIGKPPLAIPAPHHPSNPRLRWQNNPHPTPTHRLGNPTAIIARPPVVDMLQLVNGQARESARGVRLSRQRHVPPQRSPH